MSEFYFFQLIFSHSRLQLTHWTGTITCEGTCANFILLAISHVSISGVISTFLQLIVSYSGSHLDTLNQHCNPSRCKGSLGNECSSWYPRWWNIVVLKRKGGAPVCLSSTPDKSSKWWCQCIFWRQHRSEVPRVYCHDFWLFFFFRAKIDRFPKQTIESPKFGRFYEQNCGKS